MDVWQDQSKLDLNERYTISKYIVAARKVFGGPIHTDPASCEYANRVVEAMLFYDRWNDGLLKDWFGNVWMNPPFNGNLASWMYKLIEQYKMGNVSQAIALYPAAAGVSSTKWYHQMLAYPMCVPFKRVNYYRDDDSVAGHPPFNSLFSYLGPNEDRFIEVFRRFGDITKKVG